LGAKAASLRGAFPPIPLNELCAPAKEKVMADELQQQASGADPVRVIVWYDYI